MELGNGCTAPNVKGRHTSAEASLWPWQRWRSAGPGLPAGLLYGQIPAAQGVAPPEGSLPPCFLHATSFPFFPWGSCEQGL